jgi:hypothetical protein
VAQTGFTDSLMTRVARVFIVGAVARGADHPAPPGPAWTQITVSIAAALLALVALQPQERDGSADGQEGVAVDGAAGEFGGATDAAEE